jgi:hypothetical protein
MVIVILPILSFGQSTHGNTNELTKVDETKITKANPKAK